MQARHILHGWLAAILSFSSVTFPSVETIRGQAVSARQPDEAALREAIAAYFDTYSSGDLEGFARLWDRRSFRVPATVESIRLRLADERVAYSNLRISFVSLQNNVASIRAWVDEQAVNIKTGRKTERRLLTGFRFAKDGAAWKLWTLLPPIQEFASELLTASGSDEQQQLLADGKQYLVTELVAELLLRANDASMAGDPAKGLRGYSIAEALAEQLGDHANLAAVLVSHAFLQFAQKHYDAALDRYQMALTQYSLLNDREHTTQVLLSIGSTYYWMGGYEQSLRFNQQALESAQAVGDKEAAGKAYYNLGSAYKELGDYPAAEDSFRKGIALRQEQQDKAGLAAMLQAIGSLHTAMGDSVSAGEEYKRAAALFEQAGSRGAAAAALENLGYVQVSLGHFSAAEESYQRSLAIQRELGNSREAARLHGSLGSLSYLRKDYEHARNYHQQEFDQLKALGDQAGTARALRGIGLSFAASGAAEEAMDAYRRSLSISRSLADAVEETITLINLAILQIGQTSLEPALESATRAVSLSSQTRRMDLRWQADYWQGECLRSLRRTEQARASFQQSIAGIQALRSEGASLDPEQRFNGDEALPYLAMMTMAVQSGKNEEAFQFAEQAKAQMMRDIVENVEARITKGLTGREAGHERQLRYRVITSRSRFRRALERREAQLILDSLESKMIQAGKEWARFERALYRIHPALAKYRATSAIPNMRELGRLIRNRAQALLEYSITGQGAFLFVLTRKSGGRPNRGQKLGAPELSVYSLNTNVADLNARVDRFREVIGRKDPSAGSLARQLYDLLVGPAAEQLKEKTQVLIVPNSILWKMSFPALQPDAGRSLAESFELSIVPSASFLDLLHTVSRGRGAVQARAPNLLIVAEPALSASAQERLKKFLPWSELEPAFRGREEVLRILALYEANSRKVLAGSDASKEQVSRDSQQHGILHFTTPLVLNENAPFFSAFALSEDTASADDGFLKIQDILHWNMRASLVLFSRSQETDESRSSGKSRTALAWALGVAGCPSSIVSLWDTGESATTGLMVEFHRELLDSIKSGAPMSSPAQALRRAINKIRSMSEFQHPYYWSGFYLLGALNN